MARAILIGLGGIGSHLVRPLATYLKGHATYTELHLVDGDEYEMRNAERMELSQHEVAEHKVEVWKRRLEDHYPSESLAAHPCYITPRNVEDIIWEDSVTFLCVDNHATRKIVGEHMSELQNGVLISGGNDGVDPEAGENGSMGNVQVHVREGGKDLTAPISQLHPEIASPEDFSPGDIDREPEGCEALVRSVPQISWANHMAASLMGAAFWRIDTGRARRDPIDESVFDIGALRVGSMSYKLQS